MKKFLLMTLVLMTASVAQAHEAKDIIEADMVKSIHSLMNSSYGGKCAPVTEKSVRWMCTGAILPVQKLSIKRTGCGFAVEFFCGDDEVSIFGHTSTYYVQDENGVRDDIDNVEAGIAFDDVRIYKK